MKQPSDALLHSVRRVLWNDWDPIGVNAGDPYDVDDPDIWTDEYDSYASGLAKLMLNGADEAALAMRLGQLSHDAMGIEGSPLRDVQVARHLLDLLA